MSTGLLGMLGALGGEDHRFPEVGDSAAAGEIEDTKAFAGEELGQGWPRPKFDSPPVPQCGEVVVHSIRQSQGEVF